MHEQRRTGRTAGRPSGSSQAVLADQLIGAAERLERAAKELKADAAVLRRFQLETLDHELFRMHKANGIEQAARMAVDEVHGRKEGAA